MTCKLCHAEVPPDKIICDPTRTTKLEQTGLKRFSSDGYIYRTAKMNQVRHILPQKGNCLNLCRSERYGKITTAVLSRSNWPLPEDDVRLFCESCVEKLSAYMKVAKPVNPIAPGKPKERK